MSHLYDQATMRAYYRISEDDQIARPSLSSTLTLTLNLILTLTRTLGTSEDDQIAQLDIAERLQIDLGDRAPPMDR